MTVPTRRRGFLLSALDAMTAARQRQADHYLNGVLLALDDETLSEHGYSRAEPKRKAGR